MASSAPPPPGTNSGAGSIVLSVVIDSKTGKVQIEGLKNLVSEISKAVGQIPPPPPAAAAGWAVLANQTAEVLQKVGNTVGRFTDLIFESTKLAASLQVANTTLGVTSRNMNISTAAALAQAQAVKAMNITAREATNLVAQFERGQLQLAKATDLARAAQDFAVLSNTNSSQALGTLIESIQNQEVVTLRQFGIVTQSQIVFDRYAASLNRSAASLTSLEKRQAFLNYILEEGTKVSGAYSAAMDDAGKKATSLARLTENAKVQMGKGFVPAYALGVDVLSKILEQLEKVDPAIYTVIGGLAAFTTVMGGLAAAVLAGGKAIVFFRESMLALNLTSASAGALLSNPWFLAAAAIAAATVAITLYIAKQNQALKEAGERAIEYAAKEERVNQALKENNELNDKRAELERKRRDPSFQGPKVPGLGADESRSVALAREAASLDRQADTLRKKFGEIDPLLVTMVDSTGKLVLNTERLNKLSKTYNDEGKKSIEQLTDGVNRAMKENEAVTERILKLRSAGEGRVAIEIEGRLQVVKKEEAITALLKKQSDLQKEITTNQGRIREAGEKRSGVSLQDVPISATVNSLQQVAQIEQQIFALRQASIAPSAALKKNLEDQLSSTTTFYKEIRAGLGAQIEMEGRRYQTLKSGTSAQKEAAANLKVMAQYYNVIDGLEKQVTDTVANKQLPARERANKVASLLQEGLSKYNDGLQMGARTLGNTAEAAASLQNIMAGNVNLTRQEIAYEQAKGTTVLQYRVQALQSAVQSYEIRAKALVIEEALANAQVRQLVVSQQLSAVQAQDVQNSVRQQFSNRRQALATEIGDRVKQDAIATSQATVQAFQQSYDAEQAIITERYDFEAEQIRRIVTEKETQDKLLGNMTKRRLAEEATLERRKMQDMAALQSSLIEDAVAESRIRIDRVAPTENGLATDLDAYKNYLAERDALELQALERNDTYQKVAAQRGVASVKQLDEYKARAHALEVRRNEEIRRTETQYFDTVEQRELQRMEMALRNGIALGALNRENTEYQIRNQKNVSELNALERAGIISHELRVKLQRESLEISDKQLQIDKLAAAASNARTASGLTGKIDPQAGREAALNQVNAAKESQAAIDDLNKRYREGSVELGAYLQQIQQLQQGLLTLPDIFDAIGNGLLKQISPMQAFRATMDTIAQATGAAFQAFMNGEDAGKAFKKFIGDTLKSIAIEQAIKSIKEFAEGFAALATGNPAAALHFKAGALHAAAAAAAGGAGVGIGGRGGGSESGTTDNANNTTQQRDPIGTRTSIEDNIVRLNEAVQKNGRQLVEANAPLITLSTQFINSLNSGQAFQPLSNTLSESIGQKLSAATSSASENSATSQQILTSIHQELVRANEKEMSVSVDASVSLDPQGTSQLFEQGFVANTRKYRRQLGESVNDANGENAGRQDMGRNLFEGGV